METVGDYTYHRKDSIGHGAFAIVYKGRHRATLDNVVAIKCIAKKNLAKSQGILGKEINILKELSSLHHENLVSLLDCKETTENVYLVMEYCNGGDLSEFLHAAGILTEETIRHFARQLAAAIEALKAKGVVHRDLKPQNILLCCERKAKSRVCGDLDYQTIRLKIADFGFARILQEGVMAVTLCGSPMYMAPEVIMSQQYDAKADLWSLGTILYQCFVGQAPFQASNPQQLKQFYERSLDLKPNIPTKASPEFRDLLLRLLKRNPRDRIEFTDFFSHPFLRTPSPRVKDPELLHESVMESLKPVASLPIASPVGKDSDSNHSSDSNATDDFELVPSNADSVDYGGESDPQQVVTITNSTATFQNPRPASSSKQILIPGRASVRSDVIQLESPRSEEIIPPRKKTPDNDDVSKKSVEDDMMSSLSPPPVQFCMGTPPVHSARRMSVAREPESGRSKLFEKHGSVPTGLSGALSKIRTTTGIFDLNVLEQSQSKITRAYTLPEMHALNKAFPFHLGQEDSPQPDYGNVAPAFAAPLQSPSHSPLPGFPIGLLSSGMQHQRERTVSGSSTGRQRSRSRSGSETQGSPSTFEDLMNMVPPELSQEILLEREHNECLSKLIFVRHLVECIIEVAKTRDTPIRFAGEIGGPRCDALQRFNVASISQKWAEKLVLYWKSLQILQTALSYARNEYSAKRLQPSNSMKNSVSCLHKLYAECLAVVKDLSKNQLFESLDMQTVSVSADAILYAHALEACQSAALDELFGNPEDCFNRYETAFTLLHSLHQQAKTESDKQILQGYKDAVQKRLMILHNKGYISAYEPVL